jgi:hypothetical protein
MEASAQSDVGIVYASYAQAVDWIEHLSEEQAQEVVRRLGGRLHADFDPRLVAKGCLLPEFEDRSMSSTVVRSGSVTIFDRDPKALRIVERVLGVVEQFSSGYAWELYQEEVESALWLSMAFARYASSVDVVEDFWSLQRAMDRQNELYFDCWYDPVVDEALRDALEYEGVIDDGRANHRCLYREGFMTEAQYGALLAAEGKARFALGTAEGVFFRRFPKGIFLRAKALEHFNATGSAFYFTDTNRHSREPLPVAPAKEPTAWSKPISKGGDAMSLTAYEEFSRMEFEAGYSVYGYWFDPDGAVHAMASFQAHDLWIRSAKDGGPGFSGGRLEALAAGWVSMTMMDDLNPAANVAYRAGAENSRALKAAAKIVRRGGDFSSVVVEAYADHYRPIEHWIHDDLRSGTRQLNELANEARNKTPGLG